MNIRFGQTTRGAGKIYVRTLVEDGRDVKLEARSNVEDGHQVPACVLEDGKGWILTVPVLRCSQTVVVTATDADGSSESARLVLNDKLAALTSKANTFLKRSDIKSMRNCDLKPRSDEAYFSFIQYYDRDVIVDAEDYSVVSGQIEALCKASDVRDPIELLVLDALGKPMDNLDMGLTNDFASRKDGTDLFLRCVNFYVKVPKGHGGFVLWARFEGETPDGFRSLEPHVVRDMRGAWAGVMQQSPQGPNYFPWFAEHQKSWSRKQELQKKETFDLEPNFSIIVPLFKTPINFFRDMVDSVRNQTYRNWELLLVNASPEDEVLKAAVAEVCAADPRVKEIALDGNYGITLNTAEGIKRAAGDYVSFFDHDDVLEPDILHEYVKAINEHPETDLLYCDEDKLFEGRWQDGFFKPDFDWEMLCCSNYICHMLTVSADVLKRVPEMPGKKSDGAQDYDLTLLVAEQARNVYHVRKVLYHWRIHKGSTAAAAGAKTWTEDAGKAALQRHLDRVGIKGTAVNNPRAANMYHVDYEVPEDAKVSIVIPNKDAKDVLKNCIDSIYEKSTFRDFEIVIVENNSTTQEIFDYYEELKARHPEVKVVTYTGEFNYSAINNLGVKATSNEYLLFLNNDVEVIEPRWLEYLLGPFGREGVGVVGAKLLYPSGLIQHVGVTAPKNALLHVSRLLPSTERGYFNIPYLVSRECVAVTGACAMTKREYFDAVGGFSEEFPVAYNDVDFCFKMREKGLASVVEVRAELYHHESISRGHDGESRNKMARLMRDLGIMMQKWPDYFVDGDPYYNNNCAPGSEHYQVNWFIDPNRL